MKAIIQFVPEPYDKDREQRWQPFMNKTIVIETVDKVTFVMQPDFLSDPSTLTITGLSAKVTD